MSLLASHLNHLPLGNFMSTCQPSYLHPIQDSSCSSSELRVLQWQSGQMVVNILISRWKVFQGPRCWQRSLAIKSKRVGLTKDLEPLAKTCQKRIAPVPKQFMNVFKSCNLLTLSWLNAIQCHPTSSNVQH